jgi:hypothetical protein
MAIVNPSLHQWIKHETVRRRLNIFYILVAALTILLATLIAPGAYIFLPVIALFAGFSNVCMILSRPSIEASDSDFFFAADVSPKWFRRVVLKLKRQN